MRTQKTASKTAKHVSTKPVCQKKEIVATQDAATNTMAALCPKYAPKKTYLTRLGGEG